MKQTLADPRLFLGGVDVSGDSGQAALEYAADLLPFAPFGALGRRRAPGLVMTTLGFSGWFDPQSPTDAHLVNAIGMTDQPVILAPNAWAADGTLAWTFRAALATTNPSGLSGSVGELATFTVAAESSQGRLVEGVIAHPAYQSDGTAIDRTASGGGSSFELGALVAGQTLHAALSVLDLQGTAPTLDVTVVTDVDAGMASPTIRATFAQATAGATAQWVEAAGPITEPWWRVNYAIGGTAAQARFVVAFGIT